MSAMQTVGVELIAADNMSNIEEARTAVASTSEEWNALWKSHAPGKAAPKVDFAKRRVVAVFLGSRPTAGYQIEIIGTKTEGNNVIVEWSEVRPQPGLLTAQVLTSPAAFASIPASKAEVTFRKVTR
jgi:hypothetical protein